MKLTKERARHDTRKFYVSQRVVNGWNRPPEIVVDAENVNAFKNAYDRHYAKGYQSTRHKVNSSPVNSSHLCLVKQSTRHTTKLSDAGEIVPRNSCSTWTVCRQEDIQEGSLKINE